MRVPVRFVSLCVSAVAVAGLTCSFPTDKSDQVHVLVTPSDSLLARGVIQRGSLDTLHARAFRLTATGDTVDIPNVDFSWQSSDRSVARVEGVGGGFAEVTGVNAGYDTITARAIPFDKAAPGLGTVRVAVGFVIDSVRPLTINYGDKLRFFGVRIQQLFGVDQGFGGLIADPFSFQGNTDGLGQIDYWVPFPTSSGKPFYIGPGFFGTASDSITVLPFDIYEPNYASPSLIDINGNGGPRTFGGLPTLFFNPALYYEPYNPVTDGPFAVDYYRFGRTDTTQAVTYILNSQVFDDTAFAYLTDSAFFAGSNYSIGGAWLSSPGNGFYYCGGHFFGPARERRTSSVIMALRTQTSPALQLLSNYGKDGPYQLIVVKGYFTVNRLIGPDRFEENDNWCRYADANFNDSVGPARKRIVVSGLSPFADSTLTIDNPNDIDWYKFRVAAPLGTDTMITIHAKSRPLSATDASDIDLYLMDASTFTELASSTNIGSTEALTVRVVAGDYYLGVVDAAAEPTRYSICIRNGPAGVTCLPPGSAPPAAIASSVYGIPRTGTTDATVPSSRAARALQFIRPAAPPHSPN